MKIEKVDTKKTVLADTDLEISLKAEDDSSDDECQDEAQDPLQNTIIHTQNGTAIDTWKEFREMSRVYTDANVSSILGEQSTTEKSPSLQDLVSRNDIVTFPELGTFKIKENFPSLASVQMLTKMLAQSISPSPLN